jgi:hypothetical protein
MRGLFDFLTGFYLRARGESCDYCDAPALVTRECGKPRREYVRPVCAEHLAALGKCEVCGSIEPLEEIYFNPRRGRTAYDDPADYDSINVCARCSDPFECEAREESARGEYVDRQVDELQERRGLRGRR